MHTGSSTALFPRGGYKGEGAEDNPVSSNDKQLEIQPVFVRFAGEVAKARKGKRLIVVNLGDAIDGFHHGSMQESLFREKDQCAAHVLLMTDFLKRVGFDKKKSDELYYVRGTEVHVNNAEHDIAKELGAVKAGTKLYVHEVLELNINGLVNVFAHHGKQRGSGQNEGNSLRNFLRDIRDDREKDGLSRIDVLWSGHTHGHTYNSHIARINGGQFHEFRGVICPSWQSKTRFAYGKVPMAVNSVGGVYVNIGVDGSFGNPRFVVQTTRDG
jgi:predicted phosphodiesterase